MLSSLADEHPTIALISADGGYTNSVDASLIDWADQELGIRLEIVTRGDDVTGFHAPPVVVERTFGPRHWQRDYPQRISNLPAHRRRLREVEPACR